VKRHRPPFPSAAAAAREVLALRGIRTPDAIDLEALAADFRITLRRMAIGNAEGRLVRCGRRGVITIDELAFLSEKWRFVMAHELGHFLLHEHRLDLSCFPKKSATPEERSRSFLDEDAASGFASVLLLPDDMVNERLDRRASPMDRAKTLASAFGVSLPVAALRSFDFTDEACAVAYVEKGVVVWCTAKRAFGVTVPKRAEMQGRGDAVEGARVVRAGEWGEAIAGVEKLYEESVVLAPFDAKVTMLWHEAPRVTREASA